MGLFFVLLYSNHVCFVFYVRVSVAFSQTMVVAAIHLLVGCICMLCHLWSWLTIMFVESFNIFQTGFAVSA